MSLDAFGKNAESFDKKNISVTKPSKVYEFVALYRF